MLYIIFVVVVVVVVVFFMMKRVWRGKEIRTEVYLYVVVFYYDQCRILCFTTLSVFVLLWNIETVFLCVTLIMER